MKRCVIVGGAPITEYGRIRGLLRPDDYVICCDCGLDHMDKLHAKPDLIIGDFDSHPAPDTEVIRTDGHSAEVITLPIAKDDTDTVFAAREALKRGYRDFLILGAVGGRFDHSLANVSILLMLEEAGASAVLTDDFSDMEILRDEIKEISSHNYRFFSLACIFGKASGVNIEGAKFPLRNGSINPDYQYAVSNEVLPDQVARVSVDEGRLLLIKDLK